MTPLEFIASLPHGEAKAAALTEMLETELAEWRNYE